MQSEQPLLPRAQEKHAFFSWHRALQVRVLDAKQVHSAHYESLYAVMDKDTKVMSMHLHEKVSAESTACWLRPSAHRLCFSRTRDARGVWQLSGNQHAESLRRKHLECWDLCAMLVL